MIEHSNFCAWFDNGVFAPQHSNQRGRALPRLVWAFPDDGGICLETLMDDSTQRGLVNVTIMDQLKSTPQGRITTRYNKRRDDRSPLLGVRTISLDISRGSKRIATGNYCLPACPQTMCVPEKDSSRPERNLGCQPYRDLSVFWQPQGMLLHHSVSNLA